MSYNLDNSIALNKAGEALKLPSFLEEILEELQEKIGCEAGSILLFEEEKQKLLFKVTIGTKRGDIKKLSVSVKEGVAGWVFQKGKPLIVNKTLEDKRFSERFDKSTGFFTKSILAVPLKLGDKVVGVMELINLQKQVLNL